MITDHSSSRSHWVFAALLGIAGLLILLIFMTLRSRADDASSSGSVTNATPVLSAFKLCSTTGCSTSYVSTLTPTESSTQTMYLEGTYTDDNGCLDVASSTSNISVTLSRTSATCTSAGNADDRSCYSPVDLANTRCSSSCASGGTSGTFSCSIPTRWVMDATDAGTYSATTWTGAVTVTDKSSASVSSSTPTFEVGTLNALDLSASSVSFGTIALGAQGSDQSLNIINTGNNNVLDLTLSATNMSCDKVGTINATQIRMATNSAVTWATKASHFAFATSNQSLTNFDLSKSITTTTATRSSSTVYLQLGLPSTGVAGTCTGTITFTGA